MIAPNVGGMIQQGIEKGQQQRQQNMAKGALAALVRDPTNQRALEALAQVDPQAAMQFKQQLETGHSGRRGALRQRPRGRTGRRSSSTLRPASGSLWEALAGTSAAAFHNNPGALRVPGSMQFQRFSSPQEGIQAQHGLLSPLHDRGLGTWRVSLKLTRPAKAGAATTPTSKSTITLATSLTVWASILAMRFRPRLSPSWGRQCASLKPARRYFDG
jgi:hypothetical protein